MSVIQGGSHDIKLASDATASPTTAVELILAKDEEGNPVEGEPIEIQDPYAKYDMNEIFALINCTTSNLRELAEDIGTFTDKINSAEEKQKRGFNVGNLIMNLEKLSMNIKKSF